MTWSRRGGTPSRGDGWSEMGGKWPAGGWNFVCAVGSGEWAEPPHSPWTLRRRGPKMGIFCPFLEALRGPFLDPKRGPMGHRGSLSVGSQSAPRGGPLTPSEGLDLRRPRAPWGSGSPAPPAPIGAASPVGLGVLGRKPPAGQDPMTSRGPQRATLWALGTAQNGEGKRYLVGMRRMRSSPSASELMELDHLKRAGAARAMSRWKHDERQPRRDIHSDPS